MIDLRRTFEKILEQYGHDILLQRRLEDMIIDQYRKPQFGKLERHTVRDMNASTIGLAGMQQEEVEGVLRNHNIAYWFRWDANPRDGDMIHEILEVKRSYTIDLAYPMRGARGRIEYWACGVTKVDG
jgi:hypothetical protein